MRLWVKTSLIAIAVCVLAMELCTLLVLSYMSNVEVDKAAQAALNDHYYFCASFSASVEAEKEAGLSVVTNRGITQYYFRNLAAYHEARLAFFSLVQEGAYLHNRSPYDPLSLISEPAEAARAYAVMDLDGQQVMLVAGCLTLLDQTYTVYYSQVVTPVYRDIEALAWRLSWMMCVSAAVLSLVLLTLNRLALRPLSRLSAAARRISSGHFGERVEGDSQDEVGELNRSFNQMAQAVQKHIRKIEAISQQRKLLLSSLTHELKTPLTAAIGYADSLLHLKLSREQQQRALLRVYEQCLLMERLSQKLMRLISLDSGEESVLAPLSVEALFAHVRDTAAPALAQRGQTLVISQAGPDALCGDFDLLTSLLVNLIDNAGKASPDGSAIELSARRENACPVLEVRDTGAGMPPEELEHVTQPFYRVDRSRSRKHGGVGLGLSLCALIAQKHAAQLRIESQLGAGTRVSVIFPKEERP